MPDARITKADWPTLSDYPEYVAADEKLAAWKKHRIELQSERRKHHEDVCSAKLAHTQFGRRVAKLLDGGDPGTAVLERELDDQLVQITNKERDAAAVIEELEKRLVSETRKAGLQAGQKLKPEHRSIVQRKAKAAKALREADIEERDLFLYVRDQGFGETCGLRPMFFPAGDHPGENDYAPVNMFLRECAEHGFSV